MKHLFLFCLCTFTSSLLLAQNKKPIEHADVHRWRKIEQQRISNDGKSVAWTQVPVSEGDPELHLFDTYNGKETIFPRGTDAVFSEDNRWLIFRIKPALDTLKALRRKKVKDEDLPKDTLCVLDLSGQRPLEKIPRLKNFSMPDKWSGWLTFQIEPEKVEKPAPAKKDTAAVKPDTLKTANVTPPASTATSKVKKKTPKKEDKENGYRLIVRNLPKGFQDTIAYVKEYTLAKRGARILLHSTGKGDTMTFAANPKVLQNGVYLLDLEQYSLRSLFRSKGKFQQLSIDEYGNQAAFVADLDTTKARIRPWQLGYWEAKSDSAKIIAGPESSFLPTHQSPITHQPTTKYGISEHARLTFSEDASKLYFGMASPPVLNDTTLLKEEIVDVEVWAWNDKRLYTQEETGLKARKNVPITWCFIPVRIASYHSVRRTCPNSDFRSSATQILRSALPKNPIQNTSRQKARHTKTCSPLTWKLAIKK
jgi:hypothetical protein